MTNVYLNAIAQSDQKIDDLSEDLQHAPATLNHDMAMDDLVSPDMSLFKTPSRFYHPLFKQASFVPDDLEINSWDDLKVYFDDLQTRPIQNKKQLKKLILDYNETLKVFEEAYAWAYINNSRYTENEGYRARLKLFDTQIVPEYGRATNAVEKRIVGSDIFNELPEERYGQLQRLLNRQLSLFNEENLPLQAQLSELESQYGALVGGLVVTVRGDELTIQQARALTRSGDRELRKEAWFAMNDAYKDIKPQLDELYNQQIKLRHQIALNAGYDNYRDYAHVARMRFAYSVEDTQQLHESVKEHVVPLAKELYHKHRENLGLSIEEFRPWDAQWRNLSSLPGQEPLKPFSDSEELKDKAITIFDRLNPEFGDNLRAMDEADLFDLDSRPGKRPGGYNYPLLKTGMPFIFMNAVGTHGNVETMMHEGGHAVHTFLIADEPIVAYQDMPAEMAETASMAMELLTMDFWDEYYPEKSDHIRAMRQQLEGAIMFLPWGAVVDAFQQWVYTNPNHTVEQRDAKFKQLMKDYGLFEHNWEGLDKYMMNDMLMQSHIYTNAFYYIEYVIAQLGALQLYRNYINNPEEGLDGYVRGLEMGYSRPLPEIWQNMGIEFDFSSGKIQELMGFTGERLENSQYLSKKSPYDSQIFEPSPPDRPR